MAGSLVSLTNSVTSALSNHAAQMAKLQEQAATGLRINRVSDDPGDAYRLLNLQTMDRQKTSFMSGMSDVMDFLDISSGIVQNFSEKMTSIRQQLTSITSAIHSQNADTKASAADGIDMMIEDLVSLANWQHRGQWLFGGADSTQAPYSVNRDNGMITSVEYVGADFARQVEVNDNLNVEMNIVGSELFAANNRSTLEFLGNTGCAAGTGTPTVKGDVWLTVEQTAGGYRLSIDNGDTWTNVSFPPGDANTAVANAEGKILYVDTTNIQQAGTEPVRVKGTYDVFNLLISIRDLLLNTHDLSLTDQDNLIQRAVAEFQNLHEKVTQGLTSAGGRIGSLEMMKQSLEEAKYNLQEEISALGDADITQLSVDLSKRETLYQMSMLIASKLFNMTLLNYV